MNEWMIELLQIWLKDLKSSEWVSDCLRNLVLNLFNWLRRVKRFKINQIAKKQNSWA
jgi:hypothetical protein